MAEALELLVDLQRQLPGRCQYQRAGAVLSLEAFEDGEHECQRLAGAGRRRTDHVLALQRRRDGLCLDGRGRLEAFPLQSDETLLRQAQGGKSHLRPTAPAASACGSPHIRQTSPSMGASMRHHRCRGSRFARMMETSSTDRLLTRSAAAWTSKEWASPDFFRMQRQEPRARFSRAPGKLAR